MTMKFKSPALNSSASDSIEMFDWKLSASHQGHLNDTGLEEIMSECFVILRYLCHNQAVEDMLKT